MRLESMVPGNNLPLLLMDNFYILSKAFLYFPTYLQWEYIAVIIRKEKKWQHDFTF